MQLSFIDIQNFRKLKNCRVAFSEQETVFVGANNSGKTSAMDALIIFLKNKCKDFTVRDFTLSNWRYINQIASGWLADSNGGKRDMSQANWLPYVPTLDVWLNVRDNEVHYVSHLIPTLDWEGGKLGVRLVFEPKDMTKLYVAYKLACERAKETSAAHGGALQLWPKSIHDFLEKDNLLQKHFAIAAYILDPAVAGEPTPQLLPAESEPIDGEPFKGLFKIDIINAQRGFSDTNSENGRNDDRRLSSQLRGYFEKHLNPSELPEASDLDALEAMDKARVEFDRKLKESFSASIGELENLNYPGFSDPKILIASKVDPLQGIRHEAAVQFNVGSDEDESSPELSLCLPEKYNGLGYQNLISMIFSLIRFRDEWMRVGKAGKRAEAEDVFIAPLHIVLVEEPEAHLHAQVQQVFVKKAYSVLRNHDELKDKPDFSTQLVISTHSSHIAHEIDFACLRYFKRKLEMDENGVPLAEVVNLSTTFGDDFQTAKFARRYLKTTHCDLFFADAAILVEGPVERMLIPHFIKHSYPNLNRCYVCLLEIGGSHAHKLRPLIEALGILTLVITDLDSLKKKQAADEESRKTKIQPEKGKDYVTGNDTIKSWVPEKINLDEVLNASESDKVKGGVIRCAYQCEIELKYSGENTTAIPYTFEDALVLSNVKFFKGKTDSKGLMKKMTNAVSKEAISEACKDMFQALSENSKKAEMALELLYISEPEELIPPAYIAEGLEWLENNLVRHKMDYIAHTGAKKGDDNVR